MGVLDLVNGLLDQVTDGAGTVHVVKAWERPWDKVPVVHTACGRTMSQFKLKRQLVGQFKRLGVNPMDDVTCKRCQAAVVEAALDGS